MSQDVFVKNVNVPRELAPVQNLVSNNIFDQRQNSCITSVL